MLMMMIAARFCLTLVLQTLKSLLCSWSCSFRIAPGTLEAGHFDGKSVMIVCDRASELLRSVMHHILQSDVQSLIVVSPDTGPFLQLVGIHFFPDEDEVASDCRLFFQPNDLRDKEKVDLFADNLRQNSKLRLQHVLLLTGHDGGDSPFPVRYLLQRLLHCHLLQHQSQILITSASACRFFSLFSQDPQVDVGEAEKKNGMQVKWMLIGDTSRISINNIPRLVSVQRIFLFLQQWLVFVQKALFAMNPDYISGIIIGTLGSQTSDSFFIYGKAVK